MMGEGPGRAEGDEEPRPRRWQAARPVAHRTEDNHEGWPEEPGREGGEAGEEHDGHGCSVATQRPGSAAGTHAGGREDAEGSTTCPDARTDASRPVGRSAPL